MDKSERKTSAVLKENSSLRQTVAIPVTQVLTPRPKRNSISDGLILLAGSTISDLEASERIRILRAHIERKGLGEKMEQVLTVTSAAPGEGKSVIAVNLARAFGNDPHGKTILIDCDLRKPNIHRFFSQQLSPGLSDVVIAGKSIKKVVRNVEPGLDIMTAGSPVLDSTRAIEQPGLKLMLDELRRYYRFVILDCPPVLFCSEPLFLTQLSDATLLVVRAWRTEKKLVKDAVNAIGKNKILGIVMNDCTDVLKHYGYYAYYGYDSRTLAKARAAAKFGSAPSAVKPSLASSQSFKNKSR